MLYPWSQEKVRLNEILQPLVDACGIIIQPEYATDPSLLDTRVQAAIPPDIAYLRGTTQLVQYQDQLKPIESLGAHRRTIPAISSSLAR